MTNFELNNIDDIVSDHVVSSEVDAYQYKRQGYVFCSWVHIKAPGQGTMLLVKPAPAFIKEWNATMGYRLGSLQPQDCVDGTVNWIATEDQSGCSFTVIAGNTQSKHFVPDTKVGG